jgi:hypothetical protein
MPRRRGELAAQKPLRAPRHHTPPDGSNSLGDERSPVQIRAPRWHKQAVWASSGSFADVRSASQRLVFGSVECIHPPPLLLEGSWQQVAVGLRDLLLVAHVIGVPLAPSLAPTEARTLRPAPTAVAVRVRRHLGLGGGPAWQSAPDAHRAEERSSGATAVWPGEEQRRPRRAGLLGPLNRSQHGRRLGRQTQDCRARIAARLQLLGGRGRQA